MSEIQWPSASELEWDRGVTDAKYGPSTSRKNEPRVMVHFTCTSSNGFAVPGGLRAKPGENFMLIYKKELPRFIAEFPTDKERSEFQRSQEEYEIRLSAHTSKLTHETKGPTYDEARKTAAASIGANVHGIYHMRQNGSYGDKSPVRSYPCVDGLMVRDGDVAPPETPETAAHATATAQTGALVAALREVFGPLVDKVAQAQGKAAR